MVPLMTFLRALSQATCGARIKTAGKTEHRRWDIFANSLVILPLIIVGDERVLLVFFEFSANEFDDPFFVL